MLLSMSMGKEANLKGGGREMGVITVRVGHKGD